MKRKIFAVTMMLLAAGPAVAQEAPVTMANYRSIYELKLVASETGTKVTNVSGQMYFDQDSTCEAWTSDRRISAEYQYGEGPSELDVSHYVMYESKDGKQFSFNSESQEAGQMTEQLRGSVEIASSGAAKAIYGRPSDLYYDLPKGYLLPTAHGVTLIQRARAGETFFTDVVFDGADANGPVEISTFVGKKATADELAKIAALNKKIDATLLVPEAWHIRIAVFPLRDLDRLMPAYEMEGILHANGLMSYALVDYKSFKVAQTLSALEKLPGKPCP